MTTIFKKTTLYEKLNEQRIRQITREKFEKVVEIRKACALERLQSGALFPEVLAKKMGLYPGTEYFSMIVEELLKEGKICQVVTNSSSGLKRKAFVLAAIAET